MTPLFSYCTRIVGKDKTEVPNKDGTGTIQRWTLYRNRFTNYSGLLTATDDDGNIVRRPSTRADIVKLIAHHGYATAYILKDDTLKKARSRDPNILGARHIMVDFDNTMSLEQAMQHPWWSKVWFAYTTPSFGAIQAPIDDQDRIKLPANQLAEIETQVGLPKRNFRLVFKFSRFVPAHELPEIAAGLMAVFPMADQSCLDLARLMFGSVKARTEMPDVEYELSEDDLSELKALGAQWREDNKKQSRARLDQLSAASTTADGDFNGDTPITLANGYTWTVKELLESKPLGWKEACFSPFRSERNPSAFVSRFADTGDLFVFDSGAGLKKVFRADNNPGLKLFKRSNPAAVPAASTVEASTSLDKDITLVDLQGPIKGPAYNPTYQISLSVEERRAQIKQAAANLSRFNLFFAPEGFGKSFITAALSSRLRRILFCCATNEQAEQKAAEFRTLKLNQPGFPMLTKPRVQLCLSKDYLFKQATGVAVVKKEPIDPFGVAESDKVATIEKLVERYKCSVHEAHEIWKAEHDEAAVESPDFSDAANFSIVVTTMARAEIIAKSQACRAMSDDWVVVYDDPGHSDVANLIPYSEPREARIIQEQARREEAGLAPLNIEKIAFDNRVYYVRPADARLGQNFHPFKRREDSDDVSTIPVMYTTTEELTRFMLDSLTPHLRVFDFMHDTHADNVTIWGTSLVHAKSDGLIVLAVELLKQDFPAEPLSLIGDGIGQTLNHVNNKGQNTLSTQHLVIELSQLHPTKRTQLVDELTYIMKGSRGFTERDVQTFYMRDQMHQAIGRNSGYRDKDGGFQTVVLCDPDYFQSLRDTCRYRPAPWSCQLDAHLGHSSSSKVRAKKRGIEVFSFAAEKPALVQRLQDYVARPDAIFEHPGLEDAVIKIAVHSPAAKKRVVQAFVTQVEKNDGQNAMLNRLIQLMHD